MRFYSRAVRRINMFGDTLPVDWTMIHNRIKPGSAEAEAVKTLEDYEKVRFSCESETISLNEVFEGIEAIELLYTPCPSCKTLPTPFCSECGRSTTSEVKN